MNVNEISRHVATLFSEAQEKWMKVGEFLVESNQWEGENPDESIPDWIMDGQAELIAPMEEILESLHTATICLFDANNLQSYLKHFLIKFKRNFDSHHAATKYEIDHYWSGEPYNIFLRNLGDFLTPLGVLSDTSRFLKLSGVKYLETILKNTATILHKKKEIPKSEPDVYKAVKDVIEVIFPSSLNPKSNFLKITNEYKPDILIPELHCAIEYKYADSAQKLTATIASISDDVKGYTGDDHYQVFYTVFYVTEDFWGKDKFKLAWKEKNFPDNWKAYYIVGNSKPKQKPEPIK